MDFKDLYRFMNSYTVYNIKGTDNKGEFFA